MSVADTLEEHRGYLIDARRAELYDRAIKRVLSKGDKVADLGCGFGVFGLMCLKAGASRVWGIDSTDAIDIARETAERAGFGEAYDCIGAVTFRAELPELVDLLICDHVGYFGIDYGIISLMADAKKRFLKPGGKMIPQRIDLFLAGIRSENCRKLLGVWETSEIPGDYAWLRSYAVNTKHVVDFVPTDIATEPVQVGSVTLGEDAPDVISVKAGLVIEEDGVLDGIGGWFGCELGGGVRMTNSPLAREAMSRHQIFLAFEAPLSVKAGDTVEVTVKFNHVTGIVAWTARDPQSGRLQRYSNWAALPLSTSRKIAPALLPRKPSERAEALKTVLGYVDGTRNGPEIEAAVLRDHPELMPSDTEIARFVKDVLADYTE